MQILRKFGQLLAGFLVPLLVITGLLVACGRPDAGSGVTSASDAGSGATIWYTLRIFPDHKGWAITLQGVVHTVDDGQSWKVVTPAELTEKERFGSLTSYFLNSQVGWLIHPPDTQYLQYQNKKKPEQARVFHTADGGQTWQNAEIPDTANTYSDIRSGPGFIARTITNLIPHGENRVQTLIKGISSSDPQSAWITVVRTQVHTGGGHEDYSTLYLRLWHTFDGGKTWNKTWEDTNNPSVPSGGAYFVNSSLGVMAGASPTDLLLTHDGGKNWQHQMLPDVGLNMQDHLLAELEPPTFFDTHNGVMTIRKYTSARSYKFFPYVTHDGGQSWQQKKPIESPITTQSQNQLIIYLDAQHWLVAGGNTLYRTNDSGEQDWQKIVLQTSISIGSPSFVTDQVGWAIRVSSDAQQKPLYALIHTTDGGKTWVAVNAKIQ